MNQKHLKRALKAAVLLGFLSTVLLALASLDSFLPDPDYGSLETYSGSIESIKFLNRGQRWKVKIQGIGDYRVFYVPSDLCFNLDEKISIGDFVDSRLHRRFGILSSFKAWEISKGDMKIFPYQATKKKSISDIVWENSLIFIALTAIFTLSLYKGKVRRPGGAYS